MKRAQTGQFGRAKGKQLTREKSRLPQSKNKKR